MEPQPPALAEGPTALGAPAGPLRAVQVGVVGEPAPLGGTPAARTIAARPLPSGARLEGLRPPSPAATLLTSQVRARRELGPLRGRPGALSRRDWPLHARGGPGGTLDTTGVRRRPWQRQAAATRFCTFEAQQVALSPDHEGAKQARLPAETPPTSRAAKVSLAPRLLRLRLFAEFPPGLQVATLVPL